ncbi:sensor histidine kinase [Adhaeribacter radiodurans]|uniref:Histidine kinase/HSP90-like ATPase domain-containing protein n=1 Tax=Adhaeribacter radiodurans TaxID=2745197 RepID=A0A7L7LDP7_9BACT|nr:ATP-binding protein [Adhaeribacter radiodurans]QMU30529.1 hypothetical protein HUW48_22000 [Adhaeribacter radiodurans]
MVVTNLLSNALEWAYRLVQHYKTKEQLLLAYQVLQQSAYEAERARQAKEIKALRLENELQTQRQRLGRDLHDGLGSQLTHLISRLDLMACSGKADPNHLLRLSEFAREMNQTLRETIWLLNHETIAIDAFGARLHNMLLKVWEDRDAPALYWQLRNSRDNLTLSPLLALHVLRITQEATNNTLKYANATQVNVKLTVYKSNLILIIEDNGKGFDLHTTQRGFGLNNMRQRAAEMKGVFSLHSGAFGTRICILLPLNV